MRLLVANFFPAFFPPSSGGEQRYYYLYRHLSREHDVTLLSATYPDHDEELVEHSRSFREYRVPKPQLSQHLHWQLYQDGIGDECSAFVVAMSGGVDSALRRRFRELVRHAQLVVHESPFTFPLDETAYCDGKPRVYASYNVEHRLASQMLEGASGESAARFVRYLEGLLVARSDLVFATSRDDAAGFAADFDCPKAKIRLAPNGFEPATGGEEARTRPGERPYAVFLGSGHPPNVEAARYICETLAASAPEIEFRIVGSVCKKLGDRPPTSSNVRLLGFVEEAEMRSQIAGSAAALNPLFSGSGTNLKMLQYMECGAPILATPIGARGIDIDDEVEVVVRDAAEFPAELRRLVAQPDRARAIGARARAKAFARYTWSRIASDFSADLATLPETNADEERRLLLHVNDYEVAARRGGGQVRICEVLRELGQDFDVELLCLSDEAHPTEIRLSEHVRQIAFPKTDEHRAAERIADQGEYASVRDIVAAGQVCGNKAFVNEFRALVARAAAVVFEHCYMAPLVDLVPASVPVIYSAHNVEPRLKASTLKVRPDAAQWVERVEELESRILARAGAVIAVSHEDARVFESARPGIPVVVIENGVAPAGGPKHAIEAQGAMRPSAAFLGSAHLPNIESALYIVQTLAPSLPELDFHIIGSVCDALATWPLPANIKCHGMVNVAEKERLLASCTIAVNPMSNGGGSSLKVPDFLAAGLPLVSTGIGARGFGLRPGVDYVEADLANFAGAVKNVVGDPVALARLSECGRRAIRHVTWPVLGSRVRRMVRAVVRADSGAKRKLLVVTYRLAHPAPGGAEAYLNHVLAHLGTRDDLSIDVAACDVGTLRNHWHFSATYEPCADASVRPPGISNVFRFPVDPTPPDAFATCRRLFSVWGEESCRQWESLRGRLADPALLGGWNFAESSPGGAWRWSTTRSQVGVDEVTTALRIEGVSPGARRIELRSRGRVLATIEADDDFVIEGAMPAGTQIVELTVSEPHLAHDDPRELGVAVSAISLLRGGVWQRLDLANDGEALIRAQQPEAWIDSLIEVTEAREDATDALFLRVRGPHSSAMRDWLEAHVSDYDVVLVQGTPFAPIAWAPPIARRRGVPVMLLPHYHVEDRYYHWKSYYRAFRDAECVLAFPRPIKAQFFDKLDARSELIAGGGLDLEEFAPERLEAARTTFRRVHDSGRPFVLVLGRKAGGKRYPLVLEAARLPERPPARFDIVMIGPDDDGVPVEQPGVQYYGPREREFVLGALCECVCVANMSVSESFGIVLLEAWAAGRPVIAQRRCIAFADLVRPQVNGFLAESPLEIREFIDAYLDDPRLASEHGEAGRFEVGRYSWAALADRVHEVMVTRLDDSASAQERFRSGEFVAKMIAQTRGQLEAREVHDCDFAAFRLLAAESVRCVLDIGANRGQSLASLHSVFPEATIHSFEANPVFFEVLEELAAALRGHCHVHRYGLGSEEGVFTLYVPWAVGEPFLEESSTRIDYYEMPWVAEKFEKRGGLHLQRTRARIRRGDALGLRPDVVKIDVEGAENDVIEGLAATIQVSRPILLVENSDWHRVTSTLARFGYRPFRYESDTNRLVPFHGTSTNTFYLHPAVHANLIGEHVAMAP